MRRLLGPVVALMLLGGAVPAHAADPLSPASQANNIQLSSTRSAALTPSVLADASRIQQQRSAERLALHAKDPERAPDPNPCTLPICVGDPRIQSWNGIVEPVLFTARDGATLSGHVWATREGPAKRPGVVIVNGSIIGFEQAYWWAAQTLAKDGYVVMTFDAQGEGDSDQFGEAPDQGESLIAGTPPVGDGGPFYDGGQDALDFFLSTAAKPYVPRKSRTSGTSHDAKQKRRVAAGLDAAYDPLAGMLDPAKIGLSGHSYGAVATSYLAQADPRVSAEVAWDSLCVPTNSTDPEAAVTFAPGANTFAGIPLPTALSSLPQRCFGAPPGYAPTLKLHTPALGLSADYFAPRPYTSAPNRDYKAAVSKAYSDAGVDSGNVVVRGGNHLEWSFSPTPLGTLRGIDMSAWYTAAWFDKYLKGDPTADARLLTDRWRDDAQTAKVDPSHDPNAISQLYRSRIDIHVGAKRVACEDLRTGCADQTPAAQDCGVRSFDYVSVAHAADDGRNPLLSDCAASKPAAPAASAKPATCTSRRVVTITIPRAIRRHGVRRVRTSLGSARVVSRGRRVRLSLRGVRGSTKARTIRVRVIGRDGKTRTLTRHYRLCTKR